MTCPRCQQDNPVADAQFCPRCGAPAGQAAQRATPTVPYTDLRRQLTEARDQQTATAEILDVISRSRSDVQPVFDAIVKSAVKLCSGLFGTLFQFDGELLHLGAEHNLSREALKEMHRILPMRPNRGLGAARAILEREVAHIPDVELDRDFSITGSPARRVGEVGSSCPCCERALLSVPLGWLAQSLGHSQLARSSF